MNSVYKNTIEVYNKLGKKYLNASKKITPPNRLPFSKLFPKGAHILDVGCGGGRDAKFFIQKGLRVTGVDSSPVLIKLAKKEASKGNFKCVDLLKMNFPAKTFDGIWAEAVLLHLKRKDVPNALKKLYKVLKNGGVLHVTVKRGTGEAYVKEKLSGWQERFYTYFTSKEMEAMVKKQGFTIIHSDILADKHKRKGVSFVRVWAKK